MGSVIFWLYGSWVKSVNKNLPCNVDGTGKLSLAEKKDI